MTQQIIRDGRNSYLRVPAKPDAVPSYQLRILSFNQPDQLLGMRFVNNGPDSYYEYNVSGLVSLKDAGTPELLFDYMHGIVLALEKLADTLGEYMLDAGGVCLDPASVFLQTETGRVCFCYRPDGTEPVGTALQKLMEFFMKELSPVREEEVLLLYGLFQKSREPNVTLKTLAGYWRGIERENAERRPTGRGSGEFRDGESANGARGLAAFSDEDFLSEEEDLAVYEELGLRKSRQGSSLFEDWREKQRAGSGRNDLRDETKEPWGAREDRQSTRQAPHSPWDDSPGSGMPDSERPQQIRQKEEKTGAKLSRKMKEHSFELGIGAIVAAGIIVFLFM